MKFDRDSRMGRDILAHMAARIEEHQAELEAPDTDRDRTAFLRGCIAEIRDFLTAASKAPRPE